MEDYDDDYDDGDENEWIYMDDYYDDADELAEHTCPSPSYNQESVHQAENDMYDYWADIEYLSDGGYHDNEGADRPQKRKRADSKAAPVKMTSKKQKTASKPQTPPPAQPILWMSLKEREAAARPTALRKAGKLKTVSLMRDWESQTKDQHGLVSFPEGDFQLDDGKDDNDGSEEDDIEGEGFDLGDLKQVAEQLGSDNIQALEQILQAQGMDPDVVNEVLKDLLEGKERQFSDDEEDGPEERTEDDEEEQECSKVEEEVKDLGRPVTNPVPSKRNTRGSQSRQATAGASGMRTSPLTNGHSAHGHKRKAHDESLDESGVEQPTPASLRKKPRAEPPQPAGPERQLRSQRNTRTRK